MKPSYVAFVLVGASSVAAINLHGYEEVSQESQSLFLHNPQETHSIDRGFLAARDNPPTSGEESSAATTFPTSNLAGNLSRVLMTPTTRQWTPEIGTSSQTTTFQRPASSQRSTIDSEAYSTSTQAIIDSHKTTQHGPTTPAVHDIPTPVSTMTTVPPELLIQTLTGSEWKENTWVTTTGSDGSATVVPVIVGCPGCKDRSGGGLLLWNLPLIPNVSFKFPNLPNLPQFFLPCVKLLFVEIGNCPGPVTESTDEGKQQDDEESNSPTPSKTPSKTPSTTTYSSAASSTEGCEVTRTASHCVATCSPTMTDRTSTVTCFTTACHATITGCSVSGITSTMTKMPCPTHDKAKDIDRRDLGGDSCPMGCPQWTLYDWKSSDPAADDDDQYDAKKRDFALAGRILIARAEKKPVRKIGECRIETAWPAGKPVATPAYASGPEFLEADQAGFMNVDQKRRKLSMEVPRWYSLRSAEAPACIPTTVPLRTQEMYDVMQQLKKIDKENGKEPKFEFNNHPNRPSLDHLWEKNWATNFLLRSVIDDNNAAASLADSPGGGAGKMNCKDFNAYIFGSYDEGKRGTQNLIASIYDAMPSKNNLEFVGMTQALNEKAKGLLWNPRNLNPEVAANMKDATKLPVAAALKELDKKMNFLFTIQQGVWVSNIEKAIELMQRTNNRVYNEFIKADEILAKQNPGVKALTQEGGYLSTRFRQHMDNFLDNPETGIKALVVNSADSIKQVIAAGFESLNDRSERISKAGLTQDFETGKRKWEYLRNLPRSTWEIQISWSWMRCDALARRDEEEPGACHFAPPTSMSSESTIASSLSPTETSLSTDVNTVTTTSSSSSEMITDPAGSCTEDGECRSIRCPDGSLGACLALPLGRGNACGCQPRQWPTPTVSYVPTCVSDIECSETKCPDRTTGRCVTTAVGGQKACECRPQTTTSTETHPQTAHTSTKTPPPKTTLQSKPSSTTAVPPRWTQTCNPGGLRFDKDAATGFVEEYCKKATWDDKWFSAATDGKMVKQKGISVWENQKDDKVPSFRFIIHAVKPANEGNRKAWCDTEGKGSQLNTALELLQSDDGVQECRKQLQELIKCRPDAYNADRPSGGTRAGLCLQWTLQVTRDEV